MSLFQWIKNQNYAYVVLIIVLAFFCYDITEDLIEGDSEVLLEALVMNYEPENISDETDVPVQLAMFEKQKKYQTLSGPNPQSTNS